jgi:rod shape-determining protein MreB
VANFQAAEDMLRNFLRRIVGRWEAPVLVLSVPIGATEAERRAVQEVAEAVGARESLLVDAPIAAAIGIGLPVDQAVGSMIVDVGAGKTEAAVLNLGRIMRYQSIRAGGENLDRAVLKWLRDHRSVAMGGLTAETIKLHAGHVPCSEDLPAMECFTISARGIDLSSGLPVEIDISSSEIAEAIATNLDNMVAIVAETLATLPVDILNDIAEHGIMLTGGTAALPGLQHRISKEANVSATVVQGHSDSVAAGLNRIVEDINSFRPILYSMY